MKEFIGLKGNKVLWKTFVAKVNEEHKEVWDLLEVFIKEYLAGNIKVVYNGRLQYQKTGDEKDLLDAFIKEYLAGNIKVVYGGKLQYQRGGKKNEKTQIQN